MNNLETSRDSQGDVAMAVAEGDDSDVDNSASPKATDDSNSDFYATNDDELVEEPPDPLEVNDETTIPEDVKRDLESDIQEGQAAAASLTPRQYQLEMVQLSLEKNIIAALDTGSGKTLIAILRIQAELERCPSDKLVWFLAPGVALCEQQHNAISKQLPAYPTRFLSGADDVEHWSDQSLWDAVLENIRIVVSTYQILLDALTHGFVRMSRLSLLVIDEAHNCIRKAPVNMIMKNFYHPYVEQNPETLPHILGLTASPIIRSDKESLKDIEQNLAAISRTPKLHREELLQYVHPPSLERLSYPDAATAAPFYTNQKIRSLQDIFVHLDIMEDPYIRKLQNDEDLFSVDRLHKAIRTDKTYCRDQLKKLIATSQHVHSELGSWAADYFLSKSISAFRAASIRNDQLLADLSHEEKFYLLGILEKVPSQDLAGTHDEIFNLSPKLERLIELLVDEHTPDFAGLVFVQQRAVVAVLAHLLSVHPRTRDLFRVGTFVGTSSYSGRKANSIGQLLDPRDQTLTLDELRNQTKNLIITTSVLEEGIDVSACHIVICFEKPPNLKSFIQRRGRARKVKSRYVIMFEETTLFASSLNWEGLELEMKRVYEDDMRKLQALKEREDIDEEGERCYRIEATQALLTLDNAKQHLFHFCAVSTKDPYVDPRPQFITTEDKYLGTISAKVILPSTLDPKLRQFSSSRSWKTARMAQKDAAFDAFARLYKEGLVTDHFLPLYNRPDSLDRIFGAIDKRQAMAMVPVLLDLLVDGAHEWAQGNTRVFRTIIAIENPDGSEMVKMEVSLPFPIPCVPPTSLFWGPGERYKFYTTLQNGSEPIPKTWPSSWLDDRSAITARLLCSAFPARVNPKRRDCVFSFAPHHHLGSNQSFWPEGVRGTEDICNQGRGPDVEFGVVHCAAQIGKRYVFRRLVAMPKPVSEDDNLSLNASEMHYLECSPFKVKTNFLDPCETEPSPENEAADRKIHHLDPGLCTIDNIPLSITYASQFMPSIIHIFELRGIAERLRTTILAPVEFQNVDWVLPAITAPSAGIHTNYQRLEYFGDSILKLNTSVQLLAEYPMWNEGYLSARRDRLVSNSRLSKAAIETGLGQFIITSGFANSRWSPPYMKGLVGGSEGRAKTRKMSTKTLADVVEALIGSAYLDGGSDKAVACLRVFLPEINWMPIRVRIETIYHRPPESKMLPPRFQQLEKMIGHTFSKKLFLMEAMTHASYTQEDVIHSYQRLEFLGDSVLDLLINRIIIRDTGDLLSHVKMCNIRSVLGNANFLAFLCLDLHVMDHRAEIHPARRSGHNAEQTDSNDDSKFNSHRGVQFDKSSTLIPVYFWQFMRHANSEIGASQRAAAERHAKLRPQIYEALLHGVTYPWALLARLNADKFLSDIVESTLGAIYIDSLGDWGECEKFLERIGMMKYLRRILSTLTPEPRLSSERTVQKAREIELRHPRSVLGELVDQERIRYVIERDDGHGNGGTDPVGPNDKNSRENMTDSQMGEANIAEEEERQRKRVCLPEEKRARRYACRVFVSVSSIDDQDQSNKSEQNNKRKRGAAESEIVRVGDGISEVEVRVRAADEAVRVLLKEREQTLLQKS